MTDELINFLSKNFTPLCTLLATIIGGMISYISTSRAENKKIKRTFQKERLVEILIPYCSSIENTLDISKSIYQPSDFKLSLPDYIENLYTPLTYLKAEKRAYLSKGQIYKLEEYQKLVSLFKNTWENEYTSVYIKYVHWLSEILQSFPNIVYPTINIALSISDSAKRQLHLAIVRKCDCSIINSIESVCFIHNDDTDNYHTTDISINDTTRNTYGEISYGITNINEVSDPNEYLACLFLDFISDIRDTSTLNSIIDETSTSHILISIIELLEDINRSLIKEIDHITQ